MVWNAHRSTAATIRSLFFVVTVLLAFVVAASNRGRWALPVLPWLSSQ